MNNIKKPDYYLYQFSSAYLRDLFKDHIEKKFGVEVEVIIRVDEETGGIMTEIKAKKNDPEFYKEFGEEYFCPYEEFEVSKQLLLSVMDLDVCDDYDVLLYAVYDDGFYIDNMIELYIPYTKK